MEMIVVLHGKAFETSLINMAFARRMVVGVVAHRVGSCHPAKQLTHLTIPGRLKDHVPVVGHPLVGQQLDGVALKSFRENSLERFVIALFVEDRTAGIPSIQGMVNRTRFIRTFWSRHDGTLPQRKPPSKSPDPFDSFAIKES